MSEATPRTIYSGKFVAKEKLDKAQAELAALREAATKMIDYIEDMELRCEWEWGSCRELNELKAANHMPDLYYQLVALQEKGE